MATVAVTAGQLWRRLFHIDRFIAATAGLTCQMGAHPGESAVLAAAGRQFAATIANLRYLEGSAGNILLKQDIADESLALGWGGRAPALGGPGLGVRVNEAKLEPFIVARHRITPW